MQAATQQKRKGPQAELPNHTPAFERFACISNRHNKLLELTVTYTKQTTDPRSNRYKIRFISRRFAAPLFVNASPAAAIKMRGDWRAGACAVTIPMEMKIKSPTQMASLCPR